MTAPAREVTHPQGRRVRPAERSGPVEPHSHEGRSVAWQAHPYACARGGGVARGGGRPVRAGTSDGSASSHREAPLVSADPQIDTTDVWAFVSEDRPDTVTLIASWIPFEEPAGGPNFYAWGDGVHYDQHRQRLRRGPDVTYRWVFSSRYRNPNTFLYNTGQVTSLNDPDLNFRQTYDLIRINRDNGTQKTVVNDASAFQRRRRLDAELQQQPVRRRHGGVRLQAQRGPGSPTTRSSSTCVCSTCCTGRT